MVTYFQAIILGLVQGVTELFPISSLGHSVLIADLFHWQNISDQQTADSSAFLTTLVLMHVATAVALIIFYRQEWLRIIKGFGHSLLAVTRPGTGAERSAAYLRTIKQDHAARLAWLLIAATIPAGLIGLVFEHKLRAIFGISGFAIIFLLINGVMLIRGDRLVTAIERDRPRQRRAAAAAGEAIAGARTARAISDHLTFWRAILIGSAQVGALFAGISRSGITMLAGLKSGLTHQDAARFSFLLATPIILAAGLYKLPSVITAAGQPYFGPMLVGSLLAGISAYLAVRYLDQYFQNRSLRPFGWYCIGFALLVVIVAVIRGSS